MIQFILSIARLGRSLFIPDQSARAGDDMRWRDDPLAHPALERMSQRELADLPLGRGPMMIRCRRG